MDKKGSYTRCEAPCTSLKEYMLSQKFENFEKELKNVD
jgi:hypothetical protein